jgi:glycosyltransferase involved in cell wall biosynthesis
VKPVRILFCCPTPLEPRLGASKVYLEAAAAFRDLGWEAAVVGPDEPGPLRDYLRTHAADYDVVEYEHYALPFPRSDFPSDTLMVARSVLLAHVQAAARIPPLPTLRGRLGRALRWYSLRRRWQRAIADADLTLATADLVNLPNTAERDLLVRHGHPPQKILVQPFGLFPGRLAAFAPTPDDLPDPPVVAFVGTFDPRKGLCEFPQIVAAVLHSSPAARFRLIGTAGLIPTVEGVLRFFPHQLRSHLEVIPRFDPAALPGLLTGCSAGVFPSRCEGFPFGMLEMLAAGLPVLGYDAPGLSVLLPPEYLSPCGDGAALGERAARLLADPIRLRAARRWARDRAAGFRWTDIARATADRYLQALASRRPVSVR